MPTTLRAAGVERRSRAHAAAQFELAPSVGSVELDLPARARAPVSSVPPPNPPAPGAFDWDGPSEAVGRTPAAPGAFDWDGPSEAVGRTLAAPSLPEWDAPAAPAGSAPRPSSDFGDPFADSGPAAPPTSSVPLDVAPQPSPTRDHGLFEMGRPGPPPPSVDGGPLLPEIPELTEPALPPPGASATGSSTGPFPLGRLTRPPARTRMGLDDRGEPGTARRVSGFLLNVGIAALLLVVVGALGSGYLSEGRMEWSMLSPQRWLGSLRAPSGISPTDVTNGTYETRSGRSLLYVRGRVLNRGERPARIRVEAELWDGGRRVRTSDTVAGASATPEELWLAGTSAEVDSLRKKLLAQAKGVQTGGAADFLVLFDDVPQELGSVRLRVVTSVDRK